MRKTKRLCFILILKQRKRSTTKSCIIIGKSALQSRCSEKLHKTETIVAAKFRGLLIPINAVKVFLKLKNPKN